MHAHGSVLVGFTVSPQRSQLTTWLNDFLNADSNSVSWGSTPLSGIAGRVISAQLWLVHLSSRGLQSGLNHSPHYRLWGQISVGVQLIHALCLCTEISFNSFGTPKYFLSTPDVREFMLDSNTFFDLQLEVKPHLCLYILSRILVNWNSEHTHSGTAETAISII